MKIFLQRLQERPVYPGKWLSQQNVICVDSDPGQARRLDLGPEDDSRSDCALFTHVACDGIPVVEAVLNGDHDSIILQQRCSLFCCLVSIFGFDANKYYGELLAFRSHAGKRFNCVSWYEMISPDACDPQPTFCKAAKCSPLPSYVTWQPAFCRSPPNTLPSAPVP